MNIAPILPAASAALLGAAFSLALHWRVRVRNARDLAELKASAARQASFVEESQAGLRGEIAALEELVRSAPEPPRAGALNKSTRTQALQLLRSGVSADTAAYSLGLCKSEVRLLEQVAQSLYVR
jgi:hypothetical protein